MCHPKRFFKCKQQQKYMFTIGVEQSLTKICLYKHTCLDSKNNLHKYTGKFIGNQKLKAIIEASVLSTTEGITNKITM